jgi:hypothetical protein
MVVVQASLIINDITEWHFAEHLGWKQDKKAGVPSQTYIPVIAVLSVILVSGITSEG